MSKKKNNNRNNKSRTTGDNDNYIDYEAEYRAWRARQEYLIPEAIEAGIPEYFYPAMAGELLALTGVWLFDARKDTDSDNPEHDLNPGDGRWDLAFRATCDKLYLVWLYDYYSSLKPRQRNLFDGIIEARIIRQLWPKEDDFFICEGQSQELYYRYLRGKYYAMI